MDTVLLVVQIVAYALTGIIAGLALIAPLTSSDKDDKALAALRWVEAKLIALLSVLLPGKTVEKKAPTPPSP
jgi:hypothetical protein